MKAAIATHRVEVRLPRRKPWPWAILTDDEEFLREFDHPRTGFWLVRVRDSSFRLVAEEEDPRRSWACDLPGALSEAEAHSIAAGVILSYDLGRRASGLVLEEDLPPMPGWTTFACGHRHREWVSPWGFGDNVVGRRFVVSEPIGAMVTGDLKDGLGPAMTLDPGTRLRLDAAIDDHSAGSDAYWGLYRCLLESGPSAGVCVVIGGSAVDRRMPPGCDPVA